MSGKPSVEGVTSFRSALARMSVAGSRITSLTAEMEQCSTNLKEWKEEYESARAAAFKHLEQMDVASNGNAGWEGRYSWFIVELYKQTERAIAEELRKEGK